jgi:hypothetical protein
METSAGPLFHFLCYGKGTAFAEQNFLECDPIQSSRSSLTVYAQSRTKNQAHNKQEASNSMRSQLILWHSRWGRYFSSTSVNFYQTTEQLIFVHSHYSGNLKSSTKFLIQNMLKEEFFTLLSYICVCAHTYACVTTVMIIFYTSGWHKNNKTVITQNMSFAIDQCT